MKCKFCGYRLLSLYYRDNPSDNNGGGRVWVNTGLLFCKNCKKVI